MQKVSYMGNGETTEFSFNFPYFENTDVVVTKNNWPTSGYTIVGNSAGLNADIPYIGGKVVFETAPSALDNITISRSLPLQRQYDYQPLVKIDPTTLNQDMNYTMEVIKDLQDELDTLTTQYADIADKESTATLLARIAALSQQITALGDISTLRSNVTTNTGNITTLDNRTTGMIDYVIASQNPTAENNYMWYRKYKSGWIEQGGRVTSSESWNGSSLLACAFTNNCYNIQTTMSRNSFGNATSAFNFIVSAEPLNTTSFTWATLSHNGTQDFMAFQWTACGF